MTRGLRLLVLFGALVAALAAAPVSHADHTPLAHLTADLTLPHLAAITSPLAEADTQAVSDEPDLYPFLPDTDIGGTPPFFVDRFTDPGRLLFRFDTVIANSGGTLHVFCQPCQGSARVFQVIYPNGEPPADDLPSPTSAPAAASTETTSNGAVMIYSFAAGHNHWHYNLAAQYQLIVPGSSVRLDEKVGFCFFDTFGGSTYFGGSGWCASGNPSADFVAMGISPDKGDYYNAQLTDQWIDATGLPPGDYTLRATVNPEGTLIEIPGGGANNVLDVVRTIPGAVASPGSATVASNATTDLTIAGTVVGADVASVTAANCSLYSSVCYETASPTSLTFQITGGPDHGSATITGTTGTQATVAYTPSPGYTGPDSIGFTTTDSRGLTSSEATVAITVADAVPVNLVEPSIGGTPVVGQSLVASPGTWMGAPPISFTFAWRSCDGAGAGCTPVSGATAGTYTVGNADVGRTVGLLVTATGPGGKATLAARPSAVVTAAPAGAEPAGPAAGTSPGGGVKALPGRGSAKIRRLAHRGTPRRDVLIGSRRDEIFRALAGNDVISMRAGDDIGRGGKGRDLIRGNSGDDKLLGGRGGDRLFGGIGEDTILAGPGNDVVHADDGNADRIVCGRGSDTVVADRADHVDRSCENVTVV